MIPNLFVTKVYIIEPLRGCYLEMLQIPALVKKV